MSSIFQQEIKKPAPKSPIPRSRSDFNYVGLTTKEKRWTTDFSLLLPAFPRDSSGYARLTETPVTIQPRTKTSKHLKSPYTDSGIIPHNHCTEPKKYVQSPCNTNSTENKHGSTSQPVVCCRSKHPLNNLNQVCRQHLKPEATIRKSPTFDPKILASSPRKIPNIICRSPTLDPTVLTRSPKETNRWPPSADSKNVFINRSPLCGDNYSSDVVRSQSLRSLRRSSEKSPTKLRNSESAQSDVTGSSFKPSTVVEADELEDEEDLRRLRHFSVTPKGLINWGDSFRSHSLTSVHPASNDDSQWDATSTKSYPLANSNSQWSCNKLPLRYKVAIMGLEDVGKTSLIRQFQTSEYICAFDTSYDVSNDYVITVILNEEESELEFVEYRFPDEEDEKPEKEKNDLPLADAHVVVYSVTSRRSFLRALDILTLVQKSFRRSAVILVGNKSDLVRVRAVTTDEGQTSAKEIDTLFIETSAAINHQVDELLVSILSQIRTKTKSNSSSSRWSGSNNSSSLSKAKGLIKKFLKKACFQSKSCDNLQRL